MSLAENRLRLSLSGSAQRDLDLRPELLIELGIPDQELETLTDEPMRVSARPAAVRSPRRSLPFAAQRN